MEPMNSHGRAAFDKWPERKESFVFRPNTPCFEAMPTL